MSEAGWVVWVKRRRSIMMRIFYGLWFYLLTQCQAFPQSINQFSNCLDTEATSAINKQVRSGIKFYSIDHKLIGSQILQICTIRFPAEASKNVHLGINYAQTRTLDLLNRAMEADLRQQQQEQLRKDNEYAKRVAPLLEAEGKAASSKYGDCLFQYARALALNSAEVAEIIARASFASCRDERENIIEVHQRYRDSAFTRDALDLADKRLFDVVILEIIQSRAAPSDRIGRARNE
jgi:hypothetical protein